MPLWRTQLKNSYITAINDVPVKTISDITHHISICKQQKLKDIKVTFCTIDQQAMHQQHGVPQLYHHQFAQIAQHIF